jgi:hypothetical protein
MAIFTAANGLVMKPLTIVLIAAILCGIAVLSGCVSNASLGEKGVLTGNVTVGPLIPVERIDATPILPPPEVFTSRHLIVYTADGGTRVADVDIQPAGYHGTYSVRLSPGTYVLDYPHQGVGHASPLPKQVTIEAGKTTIVDVDIDTGIR